ncbi:hypothetical protein CTI12_AA458940 [Artemisia annua]|uniref:Uncharacterized protein n=1 Tax=Artemisia annua TaxID=35608 RepID=A0A2U1LSI3_ARTAN|nr:hypothetical protein CTI12_AA458940 [Artemisia annua]
MGIGFVVAVPYLFVFSIDLWDVVFSVDSRKWMIDKTEKKKKEKCPADREPWIVRAVEQNVVIHRVVY